RSQPGGGFVCWVQRHGRGVRAVWTCCTCQNTVADDGPYEANPANYEHGHARECSRAARDAERYWQVLAEASLRSEERRVGKEGGCGGGRGQWAKERRG